ncbi:hypothetical protein K3H43_06475 [Aeromonas veronii]|uniref:hypothetical protein n=1 Tax=Aeromonas veronii TaxID=654 RepID=UPI001F19A24C|nr:hypothetical protein [Aeromonas veronii]MCF5727024.1 hypothetical protein [Aeromonas veronii]
MDNRIKFARHLHGWEYNTGDKSELKIKARSILVTEYQPIMENHIFCPHCCVGLFKSPKGKDFSSNGRAAFFAHKPGFDSVCDLRAKKIDGKHYLNEEDAKQAIQDDELVIVAGFIKDKPILPHINNSIYDQTEIEDITGPETLVPIGRHKGASFKLPSKFKTVKGIVTNFEENLHRYFHFPKMRNAILLQDCLHKIENVKKPDEQPRLYYGEIVSII